MVGDVILKCNHIMPGWPMVGQLRGITRAVFCETCQDWREIRRAATPTESAGIELPEPAPVLFDQPPF